MSLCVSPRVKLAVCKESGDCVAVKIVTVDGGKEGLTHESLRKEVSYHQHSIILIMTERLRIIHKGL